MRTRPALAAVSAVLGLVLPYLVVGAALFVTDHSRCDRHSFDCLGPFLLTGLIGIPVAMVVWAAVLHRLGQRHAWLVPLASALTVLLLARVAEPLVQSFSLAPYLARQPLLALAGGAWAALLGPRVTAMTPGTTDRERPTAEGA